MVTLDTGEVIKLAEPRESVVDTTTAATAAEVVMVWPALLVVVTGTMALAETCEAGRKVEVV